MNTLLTLRGKSFTQKSRNNGMGPITIPKKAIITTIIKLLLKVIVLTGISM